MEHYVSALAFESIPSFAKRLNEIMDSCINDMGDIISVSSVLCGLFSLVYIGNIVWQSWCKGGSINIYAVFRPFVIGLVIVNFVPFVRVLDGLCNWMNTPTEKLLVKYAENHKNHLREQLSNAYTVLVHENSKEEGRTIVTNDASGEMDNSLSDNESKSGGFFDKAFSAAANAVVDRIESNILLLLSAISLICAVAVLTVGFVSKLILIYLGPYAFALSMIPYFSRSIANWMGRYITVSLYGPCVNIICFAILCIQMNAAPSLSGDAKIGLGYFLLLSIASSLSFLAVPSISNYIVESCGAGGLTGESRGAVMQAAKSAIMKKFGIPSGGGSSQVAKSK